MIAGCRSPGCAVDFSFLLPSDLAIRAEGGHSPFLAPRRGPETLSTGQVGRDDHPYEIRATYGRSGRARFGKRGISGHGERADEHRI